MTKLLKMLATFPILIVLGSCAGDGLKPYSDRSEDLTVYNDCFWANLVSDWRPLDDENLIIFVAARRPYHVRLSRPCYSLHWDHTIGIYDRDGMVCPYGGDAILTDGAIRDRVRIVSIKRLSPAELEQLYVRFGVKKPEIYKGEELEGESGQS